MCSMTTLLWKRLLLFSVIFDELLVVNESCQVPINLPSHAALLNRDVKGVVTQVPMGAKFWRPADSLKLSKVLSMNSSLDFLPEKEGILENAQVKGFEDDEQLKHDSLMSFFNLLAQRELSRCDLIIAADGRFMGSPLVEYLVTLPNHKQVIAIEDADDLKFVNWASPNCHGSLFLISDPAILTEFSNTHQAFWDYHAKVVIFGLSEEQLKSLVQFQNRKIRKTEHILGIVKGRRAGHYKIYINNLYWGGGLQFLSTWRRSTFHIPDVFPDKISNIRKHIVNVTMFHFPPNIIFRWDQNGTVIFRYGFEVKIVRALAEVFNFTLRIEDVSQLELWGKQKPDGTFTGLVGRLGSGEADLGVGNVKISIASGRVEFIEFSSPYLSDEVCMLARVEPPLPRWQSISLPFTLETWIAFAVGLLLTGPVMCLIALNGTESIPEHHSFVSFSLSTLSAFGLHMRQGLVTMPFRTSNQVYVLFLLFYVFIITTAYGCNLTAFLTVTRQPPGVESFKELQESDLRLLGLGPFIQSLLASSDNKYHRALSTRFAITSLPEINREVLEGKAIFINSRGFLEFARDQLVTARGRPLARLVKECFAPFSVGMAFPIYSPLRDKFSLALQRMLETGLIRNWQLEDVRLYRKLQLEEPQEGDIQPQDTLDEAAGDGTDGVIPLGIGHLQGAFIIVVIGFIIACFSFLAEVCCQKALFEN